MADKSLEERVSALEAKVGSKSLEVQFREQAELIDRLFAYRFEENDKKWDAKLDERDKKWDSKLDVRFANFEERFEAKLDAKFESKLAPIRTDLTAIKDAVKIILTRLP